MIFHPFLLSAEAEGRKRIGNSIKNESSFTEWHFYQLLQTINMKTKYFALLIAAMGSSLSLGASIRNLESAYSKNSTVYDGTNGDTLDVSTPTTLNVNANGSWTMAFTVSNLTATSDSNVGLLFTYNTTKPYYKIGRASCRERV